MLGEFLVNFLLTKFLPKEHYTLIKNITLPTDDGTTQIDHILVSEFGLFVIETKNMKGWIFGNANQKLWTCGSEMALRQAKKGNNIGNQFWGCTNFPKCRKVLNL